MKTRWQYVLIGLAFIAAALLSNGFGNQASLICAGALMLGGWVAVYFHARAIAWLIFAMILFIAVAQALDTFT